MFGLSGAAAGASDALEELLKQKFIEMTERKRQAQADRSLDMQGERDAVNAKLGFGNLGVAEGNLEMRGKEYEASTAPQAEKPIVVSGRLVMPSSGRVVYEPPAAPQAPQRPVSVAPGGRLVDPSTGRVVFAAPERKPEGATAAVAAQTKQDKKEADEVQQLLSLIGEIEQDKALPLILGSIDGRAPTGMLRDAAGYERVKAKHDNLVGRLELAQAGKLKGQGAISNFEREMLAKAASALRRTLSDQDYKAELGKIRSFFSTRPMTSRDGGTPQDADPLGLFKK